MPEPKRRQAEHNAGAFYNPSGVGGGIPVPETPGRIRRVVDQLTHRLNP